MAEKLLNISFHYLDGGSDDFSVNVPIGSKIWIGRSSSCDVSLKSGKVSGKHGRLTVKENAIVYEDRGSSNGSYFKGKKVTSAHLDIGDVVSIAKSVEMTIKRYKAASPSREGVRGNDSPKTRRVFDNLVLGGSDQSSGRSQPGNTGNRLIREFNRPIVDVSDLSASGLPIIETEFLAVGGGVGSFTFVDHLRVFGVSSRRIGVIGDNPVPYGNYERYCANSQIPNHERLRSNSISTPDNIWGFPGYASREAWSGIKEGNFAALKHPLAVFGEPALSISYVPTAGQVFRSIDREAKRIGWDQMFKPGRVLALRKTRDGRFAVLFKQRKGGRGSSNAIALCNNAHLATGYPSVRFLDDLQEFKAQEPELQARVVNAYDPHDNVYNEMQTDNRQFIVVVRGRGIVASRILQRLSEVQKINRNIVVIHLLRSKRNYGTGARFRRSKRPVFNDVEIQPFNWPKSCWGGPMREFIEQSDEPTRAEVFKVLGGTTTAERNDWTELIETGLRDGWYKKYYGDLVQMKPADKHKKQIRCVISIKGGVEEVRDVVADYVIDCTGLIADIRKSPFLEDLLDTYNLPQNVVSLRGEKPVYGGFRVNNTFEIEGLRNGTGRVFSSGQLVAGGPYAAVDSFLGLQYCALRSVEALSFSRHSGVSEMSFVRSFHQWSRWVRNRAP